MSCKIDDEWYRTRGIMEVQEAIREYIVEENCARCMGLYSLYPSIEYSLLDQRGKFIDPLDIPYSLGQDLAVAWVKQHTTIVCYVCAAYGHYLIW